MSPNDQSVCPDCDGWGRVVVDEWAGSSGYECETETCAKCNGTGGRL